MAGRILNQVGLRMNNMAGSALRLPLELPWKLELLRGPVISTSLALLLLDSGCSIKVDSSLLTGGYIEGPVRKLGLNFEDHFLFPVGGQGNLRWLELKEGRGLGRPMMETGRFPMLAVHMIQVGEETGRLDDMLMQVAETYDREVEVAIRKALALLQPVMIVAMAVVIGFIIIAILSAMLSVYDMPI